MTRKLIKILCLLISFVFILNLQPIAMAKVYNYVDLYKSGSSNTNYVELRKINDKIWMHTSYENYEDNITPSNGLIVVSSKGLILIDTPWNNLQTEELIKLTKKIFNKSISLAIITHAHKDRIGGIDTLLKNKIDVRSTELTAILAEKYKFKKPNPVLNKQPNITFGDIQLETYFPGEGHTVDNIVIWFPQFKILFGGCFIKSLDTTNINNIDDANLVEWPKSINNLLKKYPDIKIVVPGHGEFGNKELINQTLNVLENYKVQYAEETNSLQNIGLLKEYIKTQEQKGVIFNDILKTRVTRQQAVEFCITLFGLEDEKKSITSQEAYKELSVFSDRNQISSSYYQSLAIALKHNLIYGKQKSLFTKEIFFEPKEIITGNEMAEMIAKYLGYTDVKLKTAACYLAGIDGSTYDADVAFEDGNKQLINDKAFGMMYGALTAIFKGEDESIIERLVKEGKISRDYVIEESFGW